MKNILFVILSIFPALLIAQTGPILSEYHGVVRITGVVIVTDTVWDVTVLSSNFQGGFDGENNIPYVFEDMDTSMTLFINCAFFDITDVTETVPGVITTLEVRRSSLVGADPTIGDYAAIYNRTSNRALVQLVKMAVEPGDPALSVEDQQCLMNHLINQLDIDLESLDTGFGAIKTIYSDDDTVGVDRTYTFDSGARLLFKSTTTPKQVAIGDQYMHLSSNNYAVFDSLANDNYLAPTFTNMKTYDAAPNINMYGRDQTNYPTISMYRGNWDAAGINALDKHLAANNGDILGQFQFYAVGLDSSASAYMSAARIQVRSYEDWAWSTTGSAALQFMLKRPGSSAVDSVMVIRPTGEVTLNKYGSGTFNDAYNYVLGINSSTKGIVEIALDSIIPTNNVVGLGTQNYIPKWTPDGQTLGNSIMNESGNDIILTGASGSAVIDPVTLQIKSTTNAGDWSTTTTWGNLDFYSDDASGTGAGVRARIGAIAWDAIHGSTDLAFYNSLSSLRKAFTMTREGHLVFDIVGGQLRGPSGADFLIVGRDNSAAEGIRLYTNSSNETMTLLNNGNVGIGVTSPSYKLDVGTGGVRLAGQSAGPTGAAGVLYFDSDDNGLYLHDGTDYDLVLTDDDRLWEYPGAYPTTAVSLVDPSRELLLGSVFDRGNYKLQVVSASSYFGATNGLDYVTIGGSGRLVVNGDNSATDALNVLNRSTNTTSEGAVIRGYYGAYIGSNNDLGVALVVGPNGIFNLSTYTTGIRFINSSGRAAYNRQTIDDDGAIGIDWYYTNNLGTDFNYFAGRMYPKVVEAINDRSVIEFIFASSDTAVVGNSDLVQVWKARGHKMLIGSTGDPTAMLDVSGDLRVRNIPESPYTYFLTVDDNGNVYKDTTTNILGIIGGGTIGGTGTTNYMPKFTGTSSIGNSAVYDSGSGVIISSTGETTSYNKSFYVGRYDSNVTNAEGAGYFYLETTNNWSGGFASYNGALNVDVYRNGGDQNHLAAMFLNVTSESGTGVDSLFGINSYVAHSGAGGPSADYIAGYQNFVESYVGSVGKLYGINTYAFAGSSTTVTDLYGAYINSWADNNAVNKYTLYLDNINSGSGVNYGIYQTGSPAPDNLLHGRTRIGSTTAPSYTLDVATGGMRLTAQSVAPTGAAGARYYDSDDNHNYWHNGTVWDREDDWTTGVDAGDVYLDGTRMGIGTTDPDYYIHVPINASNLAYFGDGSNNLIINASNPTLQVKSLSNENAIRIIDGDLALTGSSSEIIQTSHSSSSVHTMNLQNSSGPVAKFLAAVNGSGVFIGNDIDNTGRALELATSNGFTSSLTSVRDLLELSTNTTYGGCCPNHVNLNAGLGWRMTFENTTVGEYIAFRHYAQYVSGAAATPNVANVFQGYWNGANYFAMAFRNNGVSIGANADPGATLDVAGDLLIQTVTQDDTLSKIAALDYTTGLVHWRDVSTIQTTDTHMANQSKTVASALDHSVNDDGSYWRLTGASNDVLLDIDPLNNRVRLLGGGPGFINGITADADGVEITVSSADDLTIDTLGIANQDYDLVWNNTTKEVTATLREAIAEYSVDDIDPDTLSFIGGSTTPIAISDVTDGILSNFTSSSGVFTYTGAETIYVSVNASISFNFSENGAVIEGWVFENGSEVAKSEFHRTVSTNATGNVGITCILELSTNDTVEIRLAPDAHTGNDEIIIENCNVNIHKI